MAAIRLTSRALEKPWGRTILPPPFANPDGRRIGELWFEGPEGSDLPLLVKYIFTSEKLSVQVHPSDTQAHARGLPNGKSECWYILDADPGATLGIGLRAPMDESALRAAAMDGSIETAMDWKSVTAGDFFYIPVGTVHSIGAGITLIEIQQSSDITYRLYDYGRPRALHLDDAVAVSRAEPYPFAARSAPLGSSAILLDGKDEPFSLSLHALADGETMRLHDDQCWFMPLHGEGTIDGQHWSQGECWLVENSAEIRAKGPISLLLSNLKNSHSR